MMFLFIIMGATHGKAPVGFAPIAIGLALTLIHLVGIPVTNTSVNPARSTGPALFVGGWALAQLWLFWVAPHDRRHARRHALSLAQRGALGQGNRGHTGCSGGVRRLGTDSPGDGLSQIVDVTLEIFPGAGIDDGDRSGDGKPGRRADGRCGAGRDLDDPVAYADP